MNYTSVQKKKKKSLNEAALKKEEKTFKIS